MTPQPRTLEEAEALGWTVDRHTWPWLAYLGPRFEPTLAVPISTPSWTPPPLPWDPNRPVARAVPAFRHPPEAKITGTWVPGHPRERGHLSECPVVADPNHPAGCTCDDDSPEWTDD